MKIGILTTSHAANYGAMLQAFALQHFIESKTSNEVVMIDYFPEYRQQPWKYFRKAKGIADKVLLLYRAINIPFYLKFKKKKNNLLNFGRQYFHWTNTFYTEEELKTISDIDCFICGSDQIWNVAMNYDPVNFLSFTKRMKNVKRLAYAPSVADKIPEEYNNEIHELLEMFDAISVREEADIGQVQRLTHKNVCHVCDPVFLLSPEVWNEIAPKRRIKDPYILCYFLTVSPLAQRTVKRIREITGLKIVYININNTDKLHGDIVDYVAGPLDFVSYIRDAEYVCTNSFHCTAFSLLFKKNFIVVGKANANRRMDNLMKQTSIGDRFVKEEKASSLMIKDLVVNYENYDNSAKLWIERSKEYLLRNLDKEV